MSHKLDVLAERGLRVFLHLFAIWPRDCHNSPAHGDRHFSSRGRLSETLGGEMLNLNAGSSLPDEPAVVRLIPRAALFPDVVLLSRALQDAFAH